MSDWKREENDCWSFTILPMTPLPYGQGNTIIKVSSLTPVLTFVKQRFGLKNACLLADNVPMRELILSVISFGGCRIVLETLSDENIKG